MQRKYLFLPILILLPVLIWALFFWQPGDGSDGRGLLNMTLTPKGGDFVMQSADGEVKLEEFRGSVVLLYFGYTLCPDICPTNLALIAQALGRLQPQEQEQVRVVFVSVDPERDTLQRLKEYAAYFGEQTIGVTGSLEEIDRVAKLYGAAYRINEGDSEAGYLVDHTAFTYVLDKQGKLQKTLPHATLPERIVEIVREQLQG